MEDALFVMMFIKKQCLNTFFNLKPLLMTFTTYYYINDTKHEGKRIIAFTWSEAEAIAKELGLVVDGILIGEGDYDIHRMIADYESYREDSSAN